jgi:hypothetical protein
MSPFFWAHYGVYDLTANEGWVSVGIDHDTAEFAVESLRRWWRRMGRMVYSEATELLITADSGGGNGSRTRLWKAHLQRDLTGRQYQQDGAKDRYGNSVLLILRARVRVRG